MQDTENNPNIAILAKQLFAEMCRNQGALTVSATPGAAAAAAAAQSTAYPACGTFMPLQRLRKPDVCAAHTFRFYRGGRTDINDVQEGVSIPVIPGASVLRSQDNRPPWPTGCYSLRYRLANNGSNHDEIQIEWFLDDELVDTKHLARLCTACRR